MKIQSLFLVAVVLLSGCAGSSKKDKIAPEVSAYEKPKDSSIRLEGVEFPYCLWYNPEQWILFDSPFDAGQDVSEWTLVLIDLQEQVSIGKDVEKKAFAKTYAYKEKNVSREAYKDFVQSKVLGQDKESLIMFKDLGSEERLVNHIKVSSWTFEIQYQNIDPITVFLYFYSDNDGSVAITTFTPSKKWKENKKEMEELLNGFCLMQP